MKTDNKEDVTYDLLVQSKREALHQNINWKPAAEKLHEISMSYGYRVLQKYYAFQKKNRFTRLIARTVHKALQRRYGSETSKADTNKTLFSTGKKQRDILFLPIIDWEYRYQRPQHLASMLAQNGHRVVWVNPTMNRYAYENENGVERYSLQGDIVIVEAQSAEDEINIMSLVEAAVLESGIKDAVVIAEFPSWYPACNRLKEKYGFNIIFDYLDDIRDFTHMDHPPEIERYFEGMFRISDRTIATSQYLYDKACGEAGQTEIIRNGTEFEHFSSVYDPRKPVTERPVIGYYGEISYWFDDGLIYECAKALPGYDFVLIGDTTYGNTEKLALLPNVILLGEKPYQEIPQHLEKFDVAVIPFDAKRDLIQATNPVKFYEYLSAGKKVVATKIPELIPFQNEYALLTNDPFEFIAYLQQCVEGRDFLVAPEKRVEFAEKNSWRARVEALEGVIDSI